MLRTLPVILICLMQTCYAEEILFEDNFDNGLSEKWKVTGKLDEDYRLRNGALELRIRSRTRDLPVLQVDLPFATADTVTASVTVKPLENLKRGEVAGLCLLHQGQIEFLIKKTNIDGYLVFSPGENEFVGEPGNEEDPYSYAVKFWPSLDSAGPMRLIVRSHYAYFQVGPSNTGKYKTYFHSAIQENKGGMGFGLTANGEEGTDRWVQFDNFRVVKP